MPLFLSLATALSISAAAFFSGIHYRDDNNLEAQTRAQTNIQSNIEADHAGTADDQGEIKTVSTARAKVSSNTNVDDTIGLSAIGSLSGIFDNDDDADVSSDSSEHGSVSEQENEMETEDDSSFDVEGGIEASHNVGNVSGTAHGTIDF